MFRLKLRMPLLNIHNLVCLLGPSYYQPNPPAPAPFSVVPALRDPDFATSCIGQSGYCADAWGLRIINSQNILIYGMGLYSFFIDYNNGIVFSLSSSFLQSYWGK